MNDASLLCDYLFKCVRYGTVLCMILFAMEIGEEKQDDEAQGRSADAVRKRAVQNDVRRH
ncbi:hypothetical protein D3C84_1205330 [compost metagenome]